MPSRVIISGLGPVSALGIGIEPTWQAAVAGSSAIKPIEAFDPAGFDCRIAGQVENFKVSQYVPKSYRKATKVMARDIQLAVAAADQAARDAGLLTKGTADDGAEPSYPGSRVGAQIGAGLITAELDELTGALADAADDNHQFDMRVWGEKGMQSLYPLWLLKYLPNMLACHVTIVHDARGPSNTITCSEASAGLSIGESTRLIQRGAADVCFSGGMESCVNPMSFLRQVFFYPLNAAGNDQPAKAVRAFSADAAGTVAGEGGGIAILESLDTFRQRENARAYAELVGFGASHTVNAAALNRQPDAAGRGIAAAIKAAIKDAGIEPEQIDLIVPVGLGVPEFDRAEIAALSDVFGDHLAQVPVTGSKALAGNCLAGAGALDLCIAAKAISEQTVPAIINREKPVAPLTGSAPSRAAEIRYALTYCLSKGGQNAALVLKRFED